MPKKKPARIIPTDSIPKQVWSKRGRPSKPGMPLSEKPSITLYMGWDIWRTLEVLCKKWDCGPSVCIQRILNPFIGEVREANVEGCDDFRIDHKYSFDQNEWIDWREA